MQALPNPNTGNQPNDRVLRQVRYVPRRIDHHAGHSGYDILFPYMGLAQAHNPTLAWIGGHLPQSLAWRLWAMRPQGTNQVGLSAELGAAPWTRGGANRLCHFIYGEDTYFYTPLWRSAGNLMVATFHFEPARLIQRVSPAAVSALDAVVVVGSNQREYFERLLPADRIFVVPHHVDTDFFTPPQALRPVDPPVVRAVFVGLGNRDFDMLSGLIERTNELQVPVQFDLVLPAPHVYERFARHPNTRCHAGITDQQLLELYRAADIGVMPVIDCTANNGLLEMMATGLPVVVTDIGAIQDYVKHDGAFLVPPNNAEAFAQELQRLAASGQVRRRLGQANRERAEAEFSLAVSGRRMRAVYESLLN
jgi:glycosyltransferase involved in cell wall biosynthesis